MATSTVDAPPSRNPVLAAYRTLHDLIRAGRWPQGSRLPGERALSDELGISRATLRRALIELADAGLLESAPSRGWFVTSGRISEGPNILRSFSEAAVERGLTPGAKVLTQLRRPATIDEAEQLGLAPASDVVEIERLRLLDEIPIAVQSICIPSRLAPGLETHGLADTSLFDTLLDLYGLSAARCDYTLQADAADERTAGLLRLKPGDPVLIGYEVTVDFRESVISAGHIIYRGDAYRFTTSLFRS
jgi:GntR family transcriptional regulator